MAAHPILPENRQKFDVYRRRKVRAVAILAGGTVPLVVGIIRLPTTGAMIIAINVYMAMVVAVFLYYELRMTLVFKKDLRERRKRPHQQGEAPEA